MPSLAVPGHRVPGQLARDCRAARTLLLSSWGDSPLPKHPWVNLALQEPHQCSGAAAAGTFMPHEEGSRALGLTPGLR